MHGLMENIYQAAHQEVLRVHALLEEQAAAFNQTFTLSAEELEQLQVHAELHVSGGAIELRAPGTDVIFSLRHTLDMQTQDDAWELAAFHGLDSVAHRVCVMRVGPTASDSARRMRGARLVAVIGDYLDRLQTTNARGRVVDFMPMDNAVPARLPAVAAYRILQEA